MNLKAARVIRHLMTALLLFGACAPFTCFADSQPATGDHGKPVSVTMPPFMPVPPSPTVAQDGRVTFRLDAPQASVVEVRGSFTHPFKPVIVAMSKDGNGQWSGSTGPLEPEMYAYEFYVDGVPSLDPGNSHFKRDGARISNTFLVPGALSDLYAVQQVPHGTVSEIWYDSPTLGKARRTLVYTPPGYESSNQQLPVLYLLHGGMGDEDSWSGNGRAPQILDNLIAKRKILPMIVVMPNVNTTQTASQDYIQEYEPQGSFFNMDFPDSLVTDLVPFIDRTFRTRRGSAHRAVAGLSMGGAHALWAAFRHRDAFAWVESMSGGYMIIPGLGLQSSIPDNPQIPRQYRLPMAISSDKVFTVLPGMTSAEISKMRMFTLVIGEKDMLLAQQRTLQSALLERGINADISEVPGYAHEWAFWRKELLEMLPKLFRPATKKAH